MLLLLQLLQQQSKNIPQHYSSVIRYYIQENVILSLISLFQKLKFVVNINYHDYFHVLKAAATVAAAAAALAYYQIIILDIK